MGKKSKKKRNKRDIWDLTPEQQEEQAEKFYEFEKGKVDLNSLIDNKPKLNSNGLSSDLENIVVRDMYNKREAVVSLNVSQERGKTNMELIMGNTHDQSIKETKQPRKEEENPKVDIDRVDFISCRKITFNTDYIDDLYRLVLDDGISPTPYSIRLGLKQDIKGTYDPSDISDKLTLLYDYIISSKYPTAIYKIEDFENQDKYKFSSVATDSYNMKRFMFFKTSKYVMCYLIDDESVDNLFRLFDIFEYDGNDLLKHYISLAYAVSETMQVFCYDDDWYVEEFIAAECNMQEAFHDIFINDKGTVLIQEYNKVLDDDGVFVINMDKLHVEAETLITNITGESYFDTDDDEDDDDDDYEDEDDDDEIDDDYGADEEVSNTPKEVITSVAETVEYKVEPETKITTQTITKLEVTKKTVTEEIIDNVGTNIIDDLMSEDMVSVDSESPAVNIPIESNEDDEFKVKVVRRK